MAAKVILPIQAALLAFVLAVPASAQVAAETATILSGTGQATGRASRDLGSAVSGSINNAASQIRATQDGAAAPGRYRSRSAAQAEGYAITSGGDALEGTDAPTYRMGNGASIRVSGSLRKSTAATCSENCPESPPAPDAAP